MKSLWPLAFLSVFGTAVVAAQSLEKRLAPVALAQAEQFNRAQTVGVAVLVGVGKYPRYSGLSNLRYPAVDVDSLAEVLRKQRYLVLLLKDSDATKASVLNAIRSAEDSVLGEDLNVIFFFSGHGFAVNGENYLATLDADSRNLAASGLSIQSVSEELAKTKAQRRVMWIDACRDEPSKGVGEARSFANLQASAGTRLLLSTKAGKVSYEDEQLRQGLFSYFLAKGLQGEAAGPDGLITFQDLASYVTLQVRARSLETGHSQVPYEAGESSGDFLLARLPVAPKPVAEPGAGAAIRVDADGEAWALVKDSKDPADLEDFVKRFPSSSRAQVASLRAAQLRRMAAGTAMVPPTGVASGGMVGGTVTTRSGERRKSIELTKQAPEADQSIMITAPGLGIAGYDTAVYIDTREFVKGGTLQIDIQIDRNSRTDGSFALFRGDVPPLHRGHSTGELAWKADVQRGSGTRLEYKFKVGEVFALGLAGNWFSPQGATGVVRFTARVRR